MGKKPVVIDMDKLPVEGKIGAHCFITSTFLKSLYENSEFGGSMVKSEYYVQMNIIINRLLDVCKVKIIVDEKDPDYFYGYIIYKELDDDVVKIYYVYTKFVHRRRGFADLLVDKYCGDSKKILYCFKTTAMLKWLEEGKNKGYNIEYVQGI